MNSNHERYINGEITAGKLVELETCLHGLVGGFGNLVDEMRANARKASPLKWTKEPPDREGWWWVQSTGGDPSVVRVKHQRAYGGMLCALVGGGYMPAAYMENVGWAGPIPEPE